MHRSPDQPAALGASDTHAWAGWTFPLLTLGWAVLLSIVLTWPVPRQLSAAALGSPHADGLKHLWTLWWMRASVWREGVFPFHTHLVDFPHGMDLFPIEPLDGLAAVLVPWLDVVSLSNVLVLLNLTLTGLAGTWFGQELGGSRVGGLVAGTLLQGSAVAAFFVHVGVGELQHLWWLPLGLGLLVRARRSGAWRDYLALGVVLATAVLSGFYIGFFLGLAVAIHSLVTLYWARAPGPLVLRYAVTAGLALAVIVPVTHTFSASYQLAERPQRGAVAFVFEGDGRVPVDAPTTRLEPEQLLVRAAPPRDSTEEGYGGGRYLGWLALGMALAGVVRRPREGLPWLAVAGVGIVLAMGSGLTRMGQEILQDGHPIDLPFLYLNRLLIVLAQPLNFPVRFLAMTMTAIAGLAALSCRGAWGLLAPLAVLEVAACQAVPRPWATFTPAPMPALAALADQYPGEGVVDLSYMVRPDLGSRHATLVAQIAHQHPVNIVPIERVEFFARDGQVFVATLPLFDALRGALKDGTWPPPNGDFRSDFRSDLAVLQDAGLRLLLVQSGENNNPLPGAIVAALNDLCGPPVAATQTMAMWHTPDVDASPEERARWTAEHQASMERRARLEPDLRPALR